MSVGYTCFILDPGPPVLRDLTMVQNVCEGDNNTVSLQAAGTAEVFPFPQEFIWTRDGEAVDNTTDGGRVTYGYPSVMFHPFNRNDSGRYELSATNFKRNGSLIGSDMGLFTLNVQCKFHVPLTFTHHDLLSGSGSW